MAESLVDGPQGPEVSLAELSTEAHMALIYSLALIVGDKWAAIWEHAEKAPVMQRMSASNKKAALTKGLAELHERGIISLTRDGLGEYEPAQIHVKWRNLGEKDIGLILRDGQ